jgi:hypothetical protein
MISLLVFVNFSFSFKIIRCDVLYSIVDAVKHCKI